METKNGQGTNFTIYGLLEMDCPNRIISKLDFISEVILSIKPNTKKNSYSLDFLCCLHRRQLNRDHAVRIGLANQVRFGAKYVRSCHGGDAVLQTSGAVPTVGEQE